MSAVNGYFEEQDSSYYKKGIELIEHRWEKCIELKGDYVEKINIFFPKFLCFLCWVGYFWDHPRSYKLGIKWREYYSKRSRGYL